jgi:SAM-dependent methyltransferase
MPKDDRFRKYQGRYLNGEWRARIFRDIILDDIATLSQKPTVLDIGCGCGFDNNVDLQRQIAEASGRYIGVEPDPAVEVQSFVDTKITATFEQAEIQPHSVDLSFCVMVLEHVANPKQFMEKLREVTVPGGIFWGFTVDRRHSFCHVSRLLEFLRLKDIYLNLIRGKRGLNRYMNYPTFYKANSPKQFRSLTQPGEAFEFVNFTRVGQLDYYVPKPLRLLSHCYDKLSISLSLPGHLCAIRWQASQ